MKRSVALTVGAIAVLSLVGCQAPRWATSGPAAYQNKKTNTALFRGYSGVCATPQEAARKARESAVAQATDYIFQGAKMSELFTPEAQTTPDFSVMDGMLRDAAAQSIRRTFDDPRFLADYYTERRRDKLEVTFVTYYLYEIPRVRLGDVIRDAKPIVELRILKQGPGSTPEARRKLADESSQALEHLAAEIQSSW